MELIVMKNSWFTPRKILIALLLLIIVSSITIFSYNYGHSQAKKLFITQTQLPQSTNRITTFSVDLEPLIHALQNDTSSPIIINGQFSIPSQSLPSNGISDQVQLALVTSLLTLVASLTTVGLGYLNAYITNRENRKFDWGKVLWNKYEKEYLEFIRLVRASSDQNIIDNGYQTLSKSALIPQIIAKEIEEYLNTLRTKPDDVEKKRNEILEILSNYTNQPWSFH